LTPYRNEAQGAKTMTDQSHNFDPAKAMAARAEISVYAYHCDKDDVEYEGEAFFITGGEWEIPDHGRSFWAADVEFIGAVLFSDDNNTLVIHGHEGASPRWIERAMEQAIAA
jgi:hypothetical protein